MVTEVTELIIQYSRVQFNEAKNEFSFFRHENSTNHREQLICAYWDEIISLVHLLGGSMCRIGPMDHHLITIANLLQILAFSVADKGIKSNLEVLSNNDFNTITFYIGFQVNDDVLELSESNEIRKINHGNFFCVQFTEYSTIYYCINAVWNKSKSKDVK